MMPMPSDEEVRARIRKYAAVSGVSMAEASEGMCAYAKALREGAWSFGELAKP